MKHYKANHTGLAYLLVLMGLLSGQSYAQMGDEDLLNETEEVLNSDQIDIDGVYRARPKVTAADRVAKQRANLEDRNEQMVHKKIEDIRISEEQKLTNKLKKAFDGQMQNLDAVDTSMAAPQKVEAKVVVVAEPIKAGPSNRIKFDGGFLNISGAGINVESSFNGTLSFESIMAERYALGFQFGYAKVEMTDTANNNANSGQQCLYSGYNYQCYNSAYTNFYNQGRELEYKRIVMGLYGKMFIVPNGIIRPFIGGGINYNRTNLSYTQNEVIHYQSFNYGNEEYSSNNFSGSAVMGTEFHFGGSFGANIEIRYESILSSSEGEASQTYQNPDQQRLKNVNKKFEDADYFGVNLGLMYFF